jgi:CRISPR system Cascade subunit CasE
MITFSRARLRAGVDGSTGALVAYLSRHARDIGAAHHLIWSLFGDHDGRRPFLFRMTGASLREEVMIYASKAPQDPHGLWEIETKAFRPSFEVGARAAFSLRVNPTVSRDGKRHDLVMDARRRGPLHEQSDRDAIAQRVVPAWLAPRLTAVGLEAQQDGSEYVMRVENYAVRAFHHADGHRVRIATVDVTGMAQVVDPNALADGLLTGIGRGKAYGCGMLLIKRAAARFMTPGGFDAAN